MANESQQHALDRVRRPRVQITYDVETNGAMEKIELPLVVGVLADLSGQPKDPLKPVKERKFVNVDRDNINEVLEKSAPRLAFRTDNKLNDDGTQLNVELNFKSMDDFEPAKVAQQIAPLNELLTIRQQLTQLLSKLEGNDKLEALLSQVLGNAERTKQLADQLGISPAAAAPAAAEAPKPEEPK